ncbi:probable pre-mRNA-splicing factor ATP-dependent RNA helicase DEAH4 [Lolium rigidum]|uniref:probable pre-mRNA-splicing factor ATP-dependent RNA helicase DEAH4 n=1 Tax=Lolium rigidum TaxID=89674 RepID=UPI001F5D7FEA|nr:probable pre-mRNA-splicing factor ATP-dependent RNA helicase DEAH4 [Lolium rigidum]
MPSPSRPPTPPVLPISEHEDEIVAAVEANPVIVVIGETGSGKSTQLSQILHRRGYTRRGAIAVTQPRRVAAVSVSRRVAQELGVPLGEEVGYAIRFEDRTSEKTSIKYLTDGVLLRESLSNPELRQYSVIILDEAHERSLNTDILLGLMKRLIKHRASDLKVLITSATLDGLKVSNFFSGCPVLNIPGTIFPVEKFYSTDRPTNYVESSLRTAIDIHVKEAPGDVLIFMTGKDDIDKMVSKLEERIQNLEEGSCIDALVLPLHGSLPPEQQVRVFAPAPPDCRRFIVATNVAETSLTVDGVVFVIDCGYVKQRQYNPSTGMYSLDVVQISRVQADQRAGRAGRTRPGKCYRLYPSAIYQNEFLEATIPEIQRTSLAGSVLYLKSLNLPDIDILKFDFLDPPSRESLEDALRQLYLIDAIDESGQITDVGRLMSELPLDPSLSRTLIEANELGCLSQALTVAAVLSAEITLRQTRSKDMEGKRKRQELPDGSGLGDHVQLLQIFESWDQAGYDPRWCSDHDLQVRGMKFSKDVRNQLSQIIQKVAKGPTDLQARRGHKSDPDYRKLRRALCVGYGNQLAERMIHHNGYHTVGYRTQLVQVHPSSVLAEDEYGKLPVYVVYHELINTTRPFMRNVCGVEQDWVKPILKKLEKLNINKLSGGSSALMDSELLNDKQPGSPTKATGPKQSDVDSKIQAARERYLARKGKK